MAPSGPTAAKSSSSASPPGPPSKPAPGHPLMNADTALPPPSPLGGVATPAPLGAAMPPAEAPGRLKRQLRRAELRKKLQALALIAPLAMFLLVVFAVPIIALLQRAVASPEIPNA